MEGKSYEERLYCLKLWTLKEWRNTVGRPAKSHASRVRPRWDSRNFRWVSRCHSAEWKSHAFSCSVAYLGGHWAMPPPLWPEHKFFLNTLNQKIFFKFLGRGHSPLPRPLLQWGGDTPSPHSNPLAPPAPGTSRLWLCPPPLHKILNTLLFLLNEKQYF